MEIKGVPIGQEHNKKKECSPKIREETKRYLSQRGLTEENLTGKQWETVAQFLSAKQKARFFLIIFIIGTLLSVILAFSCYKLFKRTVTRLASYIPPRMVVIKEDGTEEVYEVDQEMLDTYGKANALMGFTICFLLFLAILSFSKIIGFIIQILMRDKVIEAFLPVNKPKPTNAI